MLDPSGLNVRVAPRGWSPRNIDAFVEEITSSPRAPPSPLPDKQPAHNLQNDIAVLMRKCAQGEAAGLTGSISVSVKLHLKTLPDSSKTWYAHVSVNDNVVLTTNTYEVGVHQSTEGQDPCDWLLPVPIIVRGADPVQLLVETSLHDDVKNTRIEFVSATDASNGIPTCKGTVLTKHASVEPGLPVDICYRIDSWNVCITLNPVNNKKFPAMVPLVKAGATKNDIYKRLGEHTTTIKTWVGSIAQEVRNVADDLRHPRVDYKMSVADIEKLASSSVQLYEFTKVLHATIHVHPGSPIFDMIKNEEHGQAELQDLVRMNNNAAVSIVMKDAANFNVQIPSDKKVAEDLLVLTKAQISLGTLVQYGANYHMQHSNERQIATLQQVVLSDDSNMKELLLQRHKVVAALGDSSSMKNSELHTQSVLTTRGLFHALDAFDYVIREIAHYLFGISTRPTWFTHLFLLKEWCAFANVDNKTQALIEGMISSAWSLRHENSVGTGRREIPDQIICQHYLAQLSEQYTYSKYQVAIANDSYQQYSSAANRPLMLSVDPTFFTTAAPEASIGEQFVNNVLAGMTNLHMIPLQVSQCTQQTIADFRKRNAGDSAHMDGRDEITLRLRLVCGIWKPDSPLRILWENVVSGAQSAGLVQYVGTIPNIPGKDGLVKPDQKLLTLADEMGGSEALVSGGHKSPLYTHFDKDGLKLLLQFLLTGESE